LLKIAIDRVPADAGRIRWGHEVRVGYFPQDHKELLVDPAMTPLEYVWAACPTESPSYVRGQLGRLLFSGGDVDKPVRALSGGEAARLVFARIIVDKPNVLLLDEPTNHLDLEAIHALVGALSTFEGTVIFVSHDRWFVSELASRIVEVTAAGLRDFPGTYPEYLERCGDDHLDAEAVVLKAKTSRRQAPAAADAEGGSWQEQKRRRNRAKDLPQRRDRLIVALEQAEARKRAIEQLYCTPGFFESTAKDELAALEREQADLEPRIEKLMAEWEEVERELTALGSESPQ
jgi:ABC-type multidrug transport system ATPase subunit